MHAPSTTLDRPSAWSSPRVGLGVRWAALAASIALLLSTLGGGYLSGIELPGRGEPATNIAAPLTGSPMADPTVGTETFGRSDCTRTKSYLSEVRSRVFLHSPEIFGQDSTSSIDRMQLQYWSFGPGVGRAFPTEAMAGIKGLVMDSVTTGVYRAAFDGPVVISTSAGSLGGTIDTMLTATSNAVELGPGEAVLFAAGTPHQVENLSPSRGFGIERLILYSGDDTHLIPELGEVAKRSPSTVGDADAGEASITVRLDGTGTVTSDDYPAGWRNALIFMEFIISNPGMPEILPPSCEPANPQQVRNVAEMKDVMQRDTGQYIGYLVWIGEGGRG